MPKEEASSSQKSPPALAPAAWVDAHGDVLFRYALMRVRNREAAEELVQETFLAALAAREAFRAGAAERTWLIGILKHKTIDYFRRRQRAPAGAEALDPAIDRAFTSAGHWKEPPKRWAVDAPALLERAEFWEIFNGCMAALPEAMGDAFAMRVLDETDAETVCQVLAVTPTNLWMLLHRARTRLRKCLEMKWFNNPPKGGR